MKRSSEFTFFKKYGRSFLAFVFVVLVVIFISFGIVYAATYKSMVDKRYEALQSTVRRIDEDLLAMSKAAQQLYYYPDSIQMMRKTALSTKDYTDLKAYSDFLQLSVLQTAQVANYYLYFPHSQVLFDKSRTYLSVGELYGAFDSFPGMSQQEFEEQILNANRNFLHSRTFKKDGKQYTVIPFSGFLPSADNMQMVILLDIGKIKQMVFAQEIGNTALRILSEGESLYDDEVEDFLSNQNYAEYQGGQDVSLFRGVVLTADSNYYDLRFQIVASRNDIADLGRDIVRGYLILFGGMALLASLILVILSFWFSRPFYRLTQAYNAQEPILRKFHLKRLLEPAATDEEIKESAKYLAISPNTKAVVGIATCAPEQIEALDAFAARIKNLRADKAAAMVTFQKKNEAIVVLYNIEEMPLILAFLQEQLSAVNKGGATVYLGLGNAYENVRGISVSCLQAKKVRSYQESHAVPALETYGNLPATADVVTLEPDIKNKIQILIASNEPQKAIELFEDNFNKTCRTTFAINPVAANNFIAQTVSILVQSTREIVKDKSVCNDLLIEISRLFDALKPRLFLEGFSVLVQKITACVPSKEATDQCHAGEIVAYIDANYNDCNLSLTKLSMLFDMNESYLSQYFKQHTSQNFSQYLEQCRMKHAVELLENTSLNINQVLEKVGYTNRNTFYKAFIRVHGVSPKIYKENILSKKSGHDF